MSGEELWPHQEQAVRAAREAYREGKRSILLVAPTGAGKTKIGVTFVTTALARGGTVLWLAHREELLQQAKARLNREGVARVGIINSSSGCSTAPIHVASIQTLVARARNGLPPATVVVFDEAHHYAAERWKEVADHYRGSVKLGLTATPERGDGLAMGDLFDCLIPVSSVRELQALGVLVQCRTFAPDTKTKDLSHDPVVAYLTHTPGERAFVFAQNVSHAETLAKSFTEQGIRAATIHADTKWALREARLAAFQSQDDAPLRAVGTLERAPVVLCNVYTLTEGVDVPEASSCILARSCGHSGMMLQMVGRVLRKAPGKTHATFIDLRGVVHRLGLPEADRAWSLSGKAIDLGEKERDVTLKPCPACGAMIGLWRTDSDGWRVCPQCRERVAEPVPVQVTHRKLLAVGRLASAHDRGEYLAKMAVVAARRKYSPGWLAYRYHERFDRWPEHGESERAILESGVQPTPPRYEDEERAAIEAES